MKTHPRTGSLTWPAACFLAAFVVVAGVAPPGAIAADRVVLCEEFTATW